MDEMQNALQELSEQQLDSVSSILSEQKKVVEKNKRVKKAKDKLDKEKKDLEEKKLQDNQSIISKVIDQKNSIFNSLDENVYEVTKKATYYKKKITSLKDKLGNSLIDGLGVRGTLDAYKSIKGALTDPKKYLKERLFGKDDHKISSMLTIKKDLVLSNSKIENLNIGLKGSINLNGQKIIMGAEKKQSLLDFDAHKTNPEEQQLKLLQEIDHKLSNLGVTGQSGGMFDLLVNGLKDIAETAILGAEGAAGGAAGIGILSKFKKVPGVEKVGKVLSKIPKPSLSGAKNVLTKIPKPTSKGALIASGLALGTAGVMGVSDYINSSDDNQTELQPRVDGGSVEKGKPYVVGEAGKELFVPEKDGTIIPNKVSFGLTKEEIAKLNLSQKNRSVSFINDIKKGLEAYNKPMTKSLSNYFKSYTEDYTNYKEDIKTSLFNMYDVLKSLLGKTGEAVASGIKYIVKSGKELLGIGEKEKEIDTKTNNVEKPKELEQSQTKTNVVKEYQPPTQKANVTNNVQNNSIQNKPQEVQVSSLTNNYSIPQLQKDKGVNYNAFTKGLVEGFNETVKFPSSYSASVMSNIVNNPFGI
jgi:hypothetical protein